MKSMKTLFLMLLFLSACRPPAPPAADVSQALSARATQQGFRRALAPRPFVFPADAGPHPDFQTEWWYYTGNLEGEHGRSWGYQLTFFRRGLKPGRYSGQNPWASHQIWFAHLALSDLTARKFSAYERWSSGALGLAGADTQRVWIENWEARGEGNEIVLRAREADLSLDLRLKPLKPVVTHGRQGLSQKGTQAGNASYYYSQTRLKTEGQLRRGQTQFQVRGLSWLDREWSTSVLSRVQTGWDWFSLQFEDGRELMVFQLRRRDGRLDPASSGTLVASDGRTFPLRSTDFQLQPTGFWRSPQTHARYPSGWQLTVPRHGLKLEIAPRQLDQELRLSFNYWEGAVSVKGPGVQGHGYVELTGYAQPPTN
jgi:predicted secreted hydrolase